MPLSEPPCVPLDEPSRIDILIVFAGDCDRPADDGVFGNLGSLLLVDVKRFELWVPCPVWLGLDACAPCPSGGNKHGALDCLLPKAALDRGGDGGARNVVSNPSSPRTESAIDLCIVPLGFVRGVGDGGGLGRFTTLAHIGM